MIIMITTLTLSFGFLYYNTKHDDDDHYKIMISNARTGDDNINIIIYAHGSRFRRVLQMEN